jgi:hypothetical protein
LGFRCDNLELLGNKEFLNPFPDRVKGTKIRVSGFFTLLRAGLPFSKIPADIQPAVKQYLESRRQYLSCNIEQLNNMRGDIHDERMS